MKKVKILIRTVSGAMEVLAEKISFNPHDDHEFAVHRDVTLPSTWIVTHISSGMSIPQQYYCTKKVDAIEQAAIKLFSLSKDEFNKIVSEVPIMG